MCLVLLPAIYSRLRSGCGNMLRIESDQYTLSPPNFFLIRRANAAYPNQKPHARAMHRVVIQSQGCGSNGRPSPASLEPPGTAVADMDAVAVSESREAGDPAAGTPAAGMEDSACRAASSRVRRATSLRSAASASAGVVARVRS